MDEEDKENLKSAVGEKMAERDEQRACGSSVYEMAQFKTCEQNLCGVPSIHLQYNSSWLNVRKLPHTIKKVSFDVDKVYSFKTPYSAANVSKDFSSSIKENLVEMNLFRSNRNVPDRKSLEPDNFSNSSSAVSERLLRASHSLGSPKRVPISQLEDDDDDDDDDDYNKNEADPVGDEIPENYNREMSKEPQEEPDSPVASKEQKIFLSEKSSVQRLAQDNEIVHHKFNETPNTKVEHILNSKTEQNIASSSWNQNKHIFPTPLPRYHLSSTPFHRTPTPSLTTNLAYQMIPDLEVLIINNNSYYVLSLLGRGGFSQVHLVYDKQHKRELAVKCISFQDDADETMMSAYKNEICLLQKLQHSDRVIKLIDYEFNNDKNCLYIVMEKGDTDLASLIRSSARSKCITAEMIMFYWSEMLRTVAVIHKEGIIHSDLKPANFVLVAGRVKLIDFGIATSLQNDMTSVVKDAYLGTFNYMSPEAIQDTAQVPEFDDYGKRKPLFKINFKSDVWSLGCILYCLVYGKTPFQDIRNDLVKLQAITSDKHCIKFPEIENKDLMDVMKKCLIRDQKKRASINELLSHPYLKTEDTPKIKKTNVDSIVKQMAALTPNRMSKVEEHIKKLLAGNT